MALLSGCGRTSSVGIEQIVANNRRAVGSGARVNSLQMDLAMQDAGRNLDAVYQVTRDGRMRIDIIADGQRVYTEAFDGKKGWDMDQKGNATIDAHGEALWHGTQFPGGVFNLEDMAANGHKLELVGREVVDEVNYEVLKLTLSDGFETYRYINPATWLIDRARDFRAFHPAVNGQKTWVETVWSDYRPVQGVMRAFTSVNNDLTSGKVLARQTVKTIAVNADLAPSIFQMPVPRR